MRRGFGKIHTKKAFWAKYNGECVEVSAKYIPKKAFWANYNGECVEVSAKYIPKKSILSKIQWRMRRGFGKIHTKKKHSGQNTMENA